MKPSNLAMSLEDAVFHEMLHAYGSAACGVVRTNDIGVAAVRFLLGR